jgi:plasmid stability protein
VPKNIQIRNVPDDVHRELTERAAAVGKSLQEYLLGRLTVEARKKVNREILEVPLVTTDGRLARAPGIQCEIDLIPA